MSGKTMSNNPNLRGKKPLSVTHPEIAKTAFGWDPSRYSSGSSKKMTWKCSKEHLWETTISVRTRPSGCPYCSRSKVLAGFNDLVTTHPEIASQAYGWDPSKVMSGNDSKLEWKCSKGHIFLGTPDHRTSRGDGCQVCSGRKIIAGVNDLLSLFPEIAAQAHGWDPSQVGAGSDKNLEWICKKGHTWKVKVSSRTSFLTGCPVCSRRKIDAKANSLAATNPELALEASGWDPETYFSGSERVVLWKCKQGHLWNAEIAIRSKGGGNCPACSPRTRFASNVDKNKLLDRVLDKEYLSLAITNPDLAQQAYGWDPRTVSAGSNYQLDWQCPEHHVWNTSVRNRAKNGCPYCSNQRLLVGFNDLKSKFPAIALEANGWDPSTVTYGTHKKLEWKCQNSHIFEMTVVNRTRLGQKCPYCANQKVFPGFNDLLHLNPSLASEANGWNPSKVLAGSSKKLSWICPLGHKWVATVDSRRAGNGCPSCANTGFDPNKDGYLYFINHPQWEMLQIGITNNPDKRLGQHAKLGWDLLEIRGPMDGHLTQQWETAILRMLKASGADLSNSKIAGKFDGFSEAWSKTKFTVSSIKELMSLTDKYEGEAKRTNKS
jgi:hypothetical protein